MDSESKLKLALQAHEHDKKTADIVIASLTSQVDLLRKALEGSAQRIRFLEQERERYLDAKEADLRAKLVNQ